MGRVGGWPVGGAVIGLLGRWAVLEGRPEGAGSCGRLGAQGWCWTVRKRRRWCVGSRGGGLQRGGGVWVKGSGGASGARKGWRPNGARVAVREMLEGAGWNRNARGNLWWREGKGGEIVLRNA